MQFSCRVRRSATGSWTAMHSGSQLGSVEVTGATREAALEKMRKELQFRLEICPCTGEMYRNVEIILDEAR